MNSSYRLVVVSQDDQSNIDDVFNIALNSKSYQEYVLKCEIAGIKPKDRETYDYNHKGILLCPYVPIARMDKSK